MGNFGVTNIDIDEGINMAVNTVPMQPRVRLTSADDVRLPDRAMSTHKGQCGRVLVVGGNTGFGGAARLAGEAAARIGAGLVSVAVRPGNLAMMAPCPALMAREVEASKESMSALDEWLAQCDVVALGPGLGRDDWALALFNKVLKETLPVGKPGKPMVVDADALRYLAKAQPVLQGSVKTDSGECFWRGLTPHPDEAATLRGSLKRMGLDPQWILTPHPGEAAALLNTTARDIEADRFDAAAKIVERYGDVCVLKGAGTLICDDDAIDVCANGGPMMASGGMGDVLTGMIAGLWAQKIKGEAAGYASWGELSPHDIARIGVCRHARAAERASGGCSCGIMAGDLFDHFF